MPDLVVSEEPLPLLGLVLVPEPVVPELPLESGVAVPELLLEPELPLELGEVVLEPEPPLELGEVMLESEEPLVPPDGLAPDDGVVLEDPLVEPPVAPAPLMPLVPAAPLLVPALPLVAPLVPALPVAAPPDFAACFFVPLRFACFLGFDVVCDCAEVPDESCCAFCWRD